MPLRHSGGSQCRSGRLPKLLLRPFGKLEVQAQACLRARSGGACFSAYSL